MEHNEQKNKLFINSQVQKNKKHEILLTTNETQLTSNEEQYKQLNNVYKAIQNHN